MRSASQGAFYILPVGGSADNNYGGVYDKTAIDETARVVVTIVYGIEPQNPRGHGYARRIRRSRSLFLLCSPIG